jgi:hypothetical protein
MRIFSILLALALTVPNFFCSNSPVDSYSTVGEDLLRDHDSTLTDFDRNFNTLSTKLKVLKVFSFTEQDTADSAQPATVHGIGDSLVLGSWFNQQSTAYAEFNGDSLIAHLRTLQDSGYTVDSVTFDVALGGKDTVASKLVARNIPPRSHLEPLGAAALNAPKLTMLYTLASVRVAFNCTPFIKAELLSDSVNIVDVKAVDTVFHSTNGTITDTQIIYDTTFKNVSFAVGYEGEQIRLPAKAGYKPRLFIHATNDTKKVDTDSLAASYLDHTVIDADSSDTLAQTSGSTGRIGVIAVDLKPVWNALDSNSQSLHFEHILQTQLTLGVGSARSTGSTISYRYLLLDSLLTGRAFFSHKNATYAKTLATDTTNGTCLTDTSILSLKNINQYILTRPPIGYIYLVPATSDFQKIQWAEKSLISDSVSFEAVYSNPR